jgi:hypothetical protein
MEGNEEIKHPRTYFSGLFLVLSAFAVLMYSLITGGNHSFWDSPMCLPFVLILAVGYLLGMTGRGEK